MNGISYGVRIMARVATTTSIKAQVIIAFNKNLSFVFTWQTKWNSALLCLSNEGRTQFSFIFFAGWRNHSHNLLFTTTTTSVLWLFKRVFIVRTQKITCACPAQVSHHFFSCNLCTSLTVFDISHFFPPRPFLCTTYLDQVIFFSRKSKTDAIWDLSINGAFFLISHLGKY